MYTALRTPPATSKPSAINYTNVGTPPHPTNMPNSRHHTKAAITQQTSTIVAAGGEKSLVQLLTHGGDGEDMRAVSDKSLLTDMITVPTLTVPSGNVLIMESSSKPIPSSTTMMTFFGGEIDDIRASPETGPVATASVSVPYIPDVDYQSVAADIFTMVSQDLLVDEWRCAKYS